MDIRNITDEQMRYVRKTIENDTDIKKHLKHLLRNTEYKNIRCNDLPDSALIQAYKYANMNKLIFEERGMPINPLFKDCMLNRSMDIEFVNIWNKAIQT